MRFVYECEIDKKQTTFGDVEKDQFFVNSFGAFCQKVSNYSYNIIATKDGIPNARDDCSCDSNTNIKRIIPKVVKIEF